MKAEIKYFHSPDIIDLEKFSPEVPDEFYFLLQIMVEEKDWDGAESFDTIVHTPKWLLNNIEKDQMIYGSHYLIVFEYDFQKILNYKMPFRLQTVVGLPTNNLGIFIGRNAYVLGGGVMIHSLYNIHK